MSSMRTVPSPNFKRTAPTPSSPPPSKARKQSVTARSLGLSKEQFASVKSFPLRKLLNSHFKRLSEVQGPPCNEEALIWFNSLQAPLQAVLHIGVELQRAFWQCHEVLRVIAESCRDFKGVIDGVGNVVMELSVKETIILVEGMDVSAGAILKKIWIKLLSVMADHVGRDGAQGVDDVVMFRCIKDAMDYGINVEEADEGDELKRLVGKKSDWSGLASCLKKKRGKVGK